MATVSLNITIDSKEKIEIGTITVENLQGSETINFEEEEEEDDEDEYEVDECGHMWDAEAYLLAAASFLTSWPDHWTGERLAKNLLLNYGDPEIEEQMKIKIWLPLMQYCTNQKFNPFVYVEEQIACLADAFIRYKKL